MERALLNLSCLLLMKQNRNDCRRGLEKATGVAILTLKQNTKNSSTLFSRHRPAGRRVELSVALLRLIYNHVIFPSTSSLKARSS
jgi:hypothetical protein